MSLRSSCPAPPPTLFLCRADFSGVTMLGGWVGLSRLLWRWQQSTPSSSMRLSHLMWPSLWRLEAVSHWGVCSLPPIVRHQRADGLYPESLLFAVQRPFCWFGLSSDRRGQWRRVERTTPGKRKDNETGAGESPMICRGSSGTPIPTAGFLFFGRSTIGQVQKD